MLGCAGVRGGVERCAGRGVESVGRVGKYGEVRKIKGKCVKVCLGCGEVWGSVFKCGERCGKCVEIGGM